MYNKSRIHQVPIADKSNAIANQIGKNKPIQKKGPLEEEEPAQGKFTATIQKKGGDEEEEPAQGKFTATIQKKGGDEEEEQLQMKKNNTGLPNQLKAGIEGLSGYSMDDVKVHYNSPQPAQLQALAYAQGAHIHVAPGQERHLPHEAWHVVQQKQGRVKPTLQMKEGVNINDDAGLEKEADIMGAKSLQVKKNLLADKPVTLIKATQFKQAEKHIAGNNFYQLTNNQLPNSFNRLLLTSAQKQTNALQLKARVNINDDPVLEKEADVMGNKALSVSATTNVPLKTKKINSDTAQRLIYLSLSDGIVNAKHDGKRPSGSVSGGKQGDHTTPFVVLQIQIVNAVHKQLLSDAWNSIQTTFNLYQDLPGWDTTPQWVLNNADYLSTLLKNKGDIHKLQEAVDLMLSIRNKLDLTSIKGGTSGHGESKWHGGLQSLETKLQNNTYSGNYGKEDVLTNMYNLFDHNRFNAMKSIDKKEMIIEQHSKTIVDAYPSVSEHFGIIPEDLEDKF